MILHIKLKDKYVTVRKSAVGSGEELMPESPFAPARQSPFGDRALEAKYEIR